MQSKHRNILFAMFLLFLSACNMPSSPAESAVVLVTSDPNATATPTPFQPFVPTQGPTNTPDIVTATPTATPDSRFKSDGDTWIEFSDPNTNLYFTLVKGGDPVCANAATLQPADVLTWDGVSVSTRGDGAFQFQLVEQPEITASVFPSPYGTGECIVLQANGGEKHAVVGPIPFGVTLEP